MELDYGSVFVGNGSNLFIQNVIESARKHSNIPNFFKASANISNLSYPIHSINRSSNRGSIPPPRSSTPLGGSKRSAGAIPMQAWDAGADEELARLNVQLNSMEDKAWILKNASRLGPLVSAMADVLLVIVGMFVLTLHWSEDDVCDAARRQRWRWWALISVVHMTLTTVVVVVSD